MRSYRQKSKADKHAKAKSPSKAPPPHLYLLVLLNQEWFIMCEEVLNLSAFSGLGGRVRKVIHFACQMSRTCAGWQAALCHPPPVMLLFTVISQHALGRSLCSTLHKHERPVPFKLSPFFIAIKLVGSQTVGRKLYTETEKCIQTGI